jgi:hypothetical protein
VTRQGYPPVGNALGTIAIASAASTSSSLDLGGAGWSRLSVGYVTFSTGAALTVQGSADGSTFKNVHNLVPTSSAAQYQPLTVATSVSGTGYAVFATPPFRYVRFLASAAIDDGGSITVYGAD